MRIPDLRLPGTCILLEPDNLFHGGRMKKVDGTWQIVNMCLPSDVRAAQELAGKPEVAILAKWLDEAEKRISLLESYINEGYRSTNRDSALRGEGEATQAEEEAVCERVAGEKQEKTTEVPEG